MKTIIKILFFISLVFIAGLFSCAKNKTSLPTNQINIDFMWWGAESETLTIKELLNKFSQLHPKIKINFMYVEWNNFWDKLDTKIAAGKPPDVSRLVWQKIGRYNKQKVFLNLKPYLPQKFKKNFLPLLWEAVEQNEEVIGIPYVTDTIALIYNKKYLRKAQIKIPQKLEEAWSWNEFEKICRLVKEKNKIKYAVAFDKNGYRLPIFFYQNGGSLTNLNYTKSNLNTKEVIESLNWLAKMHKNALGMLDSITGAIDNDDAFVQGLAAFNYGGMWMMNYFDKYQKENWGVTYLPKNKASATCFGGNLLVAYKESKYPQESWELIKFLVEPENLKKFSEKNMFIPARTDLKPNYKNFSKEAQIFINQYKTIPKHFIKENISPAFGDFYKILEEALAQIVTGQKNSHEVSGELNNEFNKFLGSK